MTGQAPIIVCDDDDMIVQIVGQALRGLGYAVQSANSGRAVLALVNSQGPRLLILDAMMPNMSGLDVLKAVRANPKTAGLPVLMLTARKDVGHISQAIKDGVNDYLAKPFALADLTARVAKLLAQAGSKAEDDDGKDDVYLP